MKSQRRFVIFIEKKNKFGKLIIFLLGFHTLKKTKKEKSMDSDHSAEKKTN